ncbi:Ger(x)C family spore germination protein [Clostridium malenominatum]|uniref:Ger(X)C family spore germination protein n=1 Tax=Clostridium malenominatum TaxID=1539 RepID=A0ABP3TT66_9CLOT
MLKRLISIIILSCFLFTGCFNYNDINRVLFATSLIIDVDEDNNPVIYIETFKPYRSAMSGSEKGERIIIKGQAKTIFEAVRNAGLSSSYKINFTQNKALIFTEKAAGYGVHDFVDFIARDQELIIRQYIAVYEGDVERLLKSKIKAEEYIGIFLADLILNIGTSSRSVKLSINDYFNMRLIPSNAPVTTLLKMSDDQLEDLITIDGGAVFKDDKLVDKLPRERSQGFNFLVNKVKTGTLEVPIIEEENKYVTLEIRNSKTKTKMEYDGEKLKLIKIIKVRTTFGETQSNFVFTDETLQKIAKGAEDNIIRACKDVFEEYKSKELDIFNIQRDFNIKYPKANKENIIRDTSLEVKVEVEIEGSSTKLGFH